MKGITTFFAFYAENVFDCPIEQLPQVAEAAAIASDEHVLSHPTLKCNLVFRAIWKALMGCSPSMRMFSEFYDRYKDDCTTPEDMITNVTKFLPYTQYGMQPQTNFPITVLAMYWHNLQDPCFVRMELLDKWRHRFGVDVEPASSLVDTFLGIQKRAVSAGICKDTSVLPATKTTIFARNPISTKYVELAKDICPLYTTMHRDFVSHIISHDHHFIIHMLCAPSIVLNVSKTNIHDVKVLATIRHVTSASKKRALVFTYHELPREMKAFCVSCRIDDQYWDLIPRISPWCLVVHDASQPIISHLSSLKHRSVLLNISNVSVDAHDFDREVRYASQYRHDVDNTIGPEKVMYVTNVERDWLHHIQLSSPFGNLTTYMQNTLLFVDFIARYSVTHKERIQRTLTEVGTKTTSDGVILLVDNRENMYSLYAIMFTAMNVPWNVVVHTSKNAVGFYKTHLPATHVVHNELLDGDAFDLDIYNDVLQEASIWESLKAMGYQHALVIQDDGMIIRPGVDLFLPFDYIGAPWADDERNTYIKENISANMVGNGGLSLRNIDRMIHVCRQQEENSAELFWHNRNRVPEDVFFVKWLARLNAKLPTYAQAVAFSSEETIDMSSIGFHKIWAYNAPKDVSAYFKHALLSL